MKRIKKSDIKKGVIVWDAHFKEHQIIVFVPNRMMVYDGGTIVNTWCYRGDAVIFNQDIVNFDNRSMLYTDIFCV